MYLDMNVLIDNLGKIVIGIIGLLLALLKVLGRRPQATLASAILTERPVSHAELLACQLSVSETINKNFKELRKELMTEVRILHNKINNIERRKL